MGKLYIFFIPPFHCLSSLASLVVRLLKASNCYSLNTLIFKLKTQFLTVTAVSSMLFSVSQASLYPQDRAI
jgi:hypothetical protein